MPTEGQGIWKRHSDDANAKATQFGITNVAQRNAFAHMYVSAQLVRQYGELAAFAFGTSQELRNHWTYRDGGTQPHDPHQRRDSFRDLWNNGIGREIGSLAVHNSWTNEQIAAYAGRAISQGIAIVDRLADPRIPANVSQLSSFDYFLRSDGASIGAIRNLAPAGTRFPTEVVGWELPIDIPTSETNETGPAGATKAPTVAQSLPQRSSSTLGAFLPPAFLPRAFLPSVISGRHTSGVEDATNP
ncbi:MAG: hypothetical protein K8F62_13465 [Pseudorhodoplanes sp.]|nr:hypothetical protein [Pseudorhodoplanes sp.]